MTEYWLQKKSLGGWSTVTWYSDLEQARTNYQRCLEKGMSGYSWRLVEAKVIEVAMLEEVTEIEAPEIVPQKPLKKAEDVKYSSSFVVNPKPANTGWGQPKLNPEQQADVNQAWGNFKTCNTVSAKPEHGLTGSVWVVHHGLKEKKRVAAGELDAMLAQGYERGGPKTKFRE